MRNLVGIDDGARIRTTRGQLSLPHPFRHHQVCSMLSHVPDLEGGVVSQLMLYGQVILLRHRRLNRVVPCQQDRIGKRISSGNASCDRTGFRGERTR